MSEESSFNLFTDAPSSETDAHTEEHGCNMIAKVNPIGSLHVINKSNGQANGMSRLEPFVGLEFDSAEDAREFYSLYADRMGFKIRTGQLYRSRTDGSISNRRFVCSKEGFQLNSRMGCPAFIRVQKRDSGKWVIDQFHKDHNHEFDPNGDKQPAVSQEKIPKPIRSAGPIAHRPKARLLEQVGDGQPCSSGMISAKRVKKDGLERQAKVEPYVGLEFFSADEAYQYYQIYAAHTGFRVRIGQLFRSKLDGSITSRRFVCSKEGFQHPSRVGCGAYMRIKRQDSGRWVVDRYQKEHNHDLESRLEASKDIFIPKKSIEEVSGQDYNITKRSRENNIGSDWYGVLFDYFQTKQAEDTGFFYAVQVDDGGCRSVFWADSRSRFSGSQFGDAIVFDTSYRQNSYLVPFSTFIAVNHHRQPVLLGCALVADESKESLTWLFQAYLRAMSDRHPLSIIADQDKAIQEAIAQVFPGTFHRFSGWQIKSKEQEYLGSLGYDFWNEYEKCVYHSQTATEFDASWNALTSKYNLKGNSWLTDMYNKRESWIQFYLRGKFLAGIAMHEGTESFFGTLLNAQTQLKEFISRYERGLEWRREEERKEDFNCLNMQAFLQTNEPVEEQCRRLYTLAVFKVFQKELLQGYSYLGYKIYEEGTICRYLLRKCGNENEKYAVTFNASDLSVNCTCQMFENEGMLCRHVFKVFQLMDIREIPSRYILHRWTKNAVYGTVRDTESVSSSKELNTIMLWSLRETACKYVEAGAATLERYRLAYEIMREGGRKLCWGR